MRNHIQLAYALILILVVPRSSQGASPEIVAVVDRYTQSLTWQSSATWDLKSHFETPKPLSAQRITKQDNQISFAKDGKRLAINVIMTNFNEKRVPPTRVEKTNFVADGAQFTWDKPDPKTGKIDRIFTESQTNSLLRLNMAAYMGCIGGYLAGFGDKNLDQVLRDSPNVTLRPQMEKVDKHTCSVLDAINPEGKISAWFANDVGGVLVKLTITSDTNSIFNGKKLGGEKPLSKQGDQLVGLTLTLDSVEISQIAGKFIPTRATLVHRAIFKDGRSEIDTTVYELSNINLNPDFSKLACFELKAPDGTPVTDIDHQQNGIKYVWKDGKTQIAVNDSDQQKIDAGLGLKP